MLFYSVSAGVSFGMSAVMTSSSRALGKHGALWDALAALLREPRLDQQRA
jgi:hypothetical protein